MTIMLPDTSDSQTIKFIPFIPLSVDEIVFLDEQQNTTQTALIGTDTTLSFYKTIDVNIELKEDSIYMMYMYNNSNLVYSDKVFATSQPISTFTINNGVYTNAPGTANQYILYGQ